MEIIKGINATRDNRKNKPILIPEQGIGQGDSQNRGRY